MIRTWARNERRLDMLEKRTRARCAKGRELWFHLRIGAAIAAGHPWLTFVCSSCQQIGEIDLRTLDRHRGATIESLVLSLNCRQCQPNPPHVKLVGLSKLPSYRAARSQI
jgi:hypothetical protein